LLIADWRLVIGGWLIRYHCRVAAQLDLPFLVTPPAAPDASAVDFVRMRRARKYILRVRPDGTVRVTVPRGGSRAEAQRFLERHAVWVEEERARVRAAHVTPIWTAGATMWLRGEPVTIRLDESRGRHFARYGDRAVRIPSDAIDLRRHIERDLRLLARQALGARLRELAAEHGLAVPRISIRNQQSRWGSCSRDGRIALNFRLVQMPTFVSDYVLVHELMHLKQQNHSRRFWRLVEQACPSFREAEKWLERHGRGLLG
jgi:predicted metal-dependent hydrolase